MMILRIRKLLPVVCHNVSEDNPPDNSQDNPQADKTPKPSPRQAAVAIKFEGGEEDLPIVTASGYGKIAEQILELAFKNGVKVREDADLAQMLAAVEAESAVPTDALIAVAEILAYVYKANGRYRPPEMREKESP
jgi:flagellar biosynthesis protein